MKRHESILWGILERRAASEWDATNPVPFSTAEVEARVSWIAQRCEELWDEFLDDAENVEEEVEERGYSYDLEDDDTNTEGSD